ncbi:Geraniol 8-hydroxylase [Bienertia sinuspersici]
MAKTFLIYALPKFLPLVNVMPAKVLGKTNEANVAVDIWQAAFTTTLNLLSSTFFSVDLGDPSSEKSHELRGMVKGIRDQGRKPNFADYLPFFKNIDPQGIRRRMGVHFHKMTDVFNSMIDQRLQGKGSSNSIQSNDDLFSAGTDTTSSTLEWAMTELLGNPEKLKKAQQELRETVEKGGPIDESDIA